MGILRNLLCVGVFLFAANHSYAVGDEGETSIVSTSSGIQTESKVQSDISQEVAVIKKIEILDSGSPFFDSIVNPSIDAALPVIGGLLGKFSINVLLDQYQLTPGNKLIFGCVEPLDIDQEKFNAFSDEKKARLVLSRDLLKRFFPNENTTYTFNEVKTVIDQAIDTCSLEEILILARSFRHVKRGVEKYPNQLGDYIAEYTLIEAIKKHEADNMMNEEKRKWFSDALYELSQTYSHLIDYKKIAFNELNYGPLTMNSSYIDSQKTRRFPIDKFELNRTSLQFEDVVFHKLNLLKCALIYNNKNLNAVNRLLEYMYYDIEKMVAPYVPYDNAFYNSLINDFKCLDLDTMKFLYTSFLTIFADNDVVKVPYKTAIVKGKLLGAYRSVVQQEMERLKAMQKDAESKESNALTRKRSHDVSTASDQNITIDNSFKRGKYTDE